MSAPYRCRCAACRKVWRRSATRAAWRSAVTEFTATSILDRLLPLDQCDDAHVDRVLARRGPNQVPDSQWDGHAEAPVQAPIGGQR